MTATALQILSSIVFAFAGASIAAASLFIAYRNNFGWKPIVLITTYHVRGSSKFPEFEIVEVEFEFWNRRKYPIVVREIKVFFGAIEFNANSQRLRIFEGLVSYTEKCHAI
jgi:hypothetical protein